MGKLKVDLSLSRRNLAARYSESWGRNKLDVLLKKARRWNRAKQRRHLLRLANRIADNWPSLREHSERVRSELDRRKGGSRKGGWDEMNARRRRRRLAARLDQAAQGTCGGGVGGSISFTPDQIKELERATRRS